MGKLSRGITLAANAHITQAMLHALIDTAVAAADAFPGTPTLYDVVMADFATVRAFGVQDAPGSPATNDLTVMSDGYLDRYDGAAWGDLTNDYVYLLNNSSITLATGNPVTGDSSAANKCKLWAGPGTCFDPMGVAVSVAAVGATLTVQVRGLAPVRVNNPILVGVDDLLSIQAAGATGLSKSNSAQSDVLGVVFATDLANPLSGNALALLTH